MRKRYLFSLVGIGVPLVVSLLAIFNSAIRAYYFRDPVAHLFPASTYVWKVTGGMITPLVISKVFTVLFLFVPPVLGGFLYGLLNEKEKPIWANVVLILIVLAWILVFEMWNTPMAH